MNPKRSLIRLAACAGLLGAAHAQFDEIQNYGDARTDGGGPASWMPLAPDGATISGGGGDFWGSSDNGSFVTNSDGSLATSADFTATARHVNTVDPSTNQWGREPLMMRAQAPTGSPLAPANPGNINADSPHYMVFRLSSSAVDVGWRGEPAGDTTDWGRNGSPVGPVPTPPIATTAHYMAIGRSGGDLYASHAADISFGIGVPEPGRWLQLHSTNSDSGTGVPHETIGADTEVTVGIGHQAHNEIPGGEDGANVTNWDNFSLADGVFDSGKFITPLGDYNVVASLDLEDYVMFCGDVTGQAFTFEGGESTSGPTGWKLTATSFVDVPIFGETVNENTPVHPADLVPAANFRVSEGVPGLNADIYLAPNPGNLSEIEAIIDDNEPDGTTVIPDIWWSDEDASIGYPDSAPGSNPNDSGDNLFAAAVPGSFDGSQGNYGVHLTGEIQIPASAVTQGFIAFKDGVDDFAYLVVDGVALIEEASWTNLDTSANTGGTIALLDTSGYTAGQWVSFEMITWQGGLSENAALYWDIGTTNSLNREAYPTMEVESDTFTATGTTPVGDTSGSAPFPDVQIPVGTWDITLMVINTERMDTFTARSVTVDPCLPEERDLPPKTFVVAAPGATSALVEWIEPAVLPPAMIEQTGGPANGSAFPLGATEVEYTTTDGEGAESSDSFLVVVSLNPGDALPIATTDDPAPGGVGNFSGFFGGYIAGSGKVIVRGEDGSPPPRAEGLWRRDVNSSDPIELVSLIGSTPPEAATPLAGFYRYYVGKDGSAAFHGTTADGSVGHWYDGGAGLDAVAVIGGVALGSRYDLLPNAGQALNEDGEFFFLGRLARGGGVTKLNNWGIWSNSEGLLLRKGDAVAAIPGATYLDFEWQIAGTTDQKLVFSAAMRGGAVINGVDNRAVFAGPPDDPSIVARKNDSDAGGSGAYYHQFGRAAINKAGAAVFSTRLLGDGVTTENNTALYTNAGGTLMKIVREGDPAVGYEDGEVYESFDDLYICGDSVWFKATVRGPFVTATTNDAFYVWRPGDGEQPVAQEGVTAPATSGVVRSLSKITATHCCQAVFTGIMQRGVGGVTRRNQHGLWHVPIGAVEADLLVRGGDTLAFLGGGGEEIIQRPDFEQTLNDGTGGRSSALGPGNLVTLLSYNGGRKSGVFLIGLAAPEDQ